ncbi:replication initiator [Actinosynnema sp. NPDC047251]|uniref:Replication initiator protein n=1 Tax=Saccharothrix espanaensis (strain ATCC 51144 / DSM 44229 / JCM 9112 / NBRC 15066 / NRRL 15764) TaxID=1179773 RepID=K0K9I2_SACES|nr:replication initiator [Saccharothrix espanaensis]CCH35001.1 Replication initiator protein [Saccharothrix espanaensis DSM 44229]
MSGHEFDARDIPPYLRLLAQGATNKQDFVRWKEMVASTRGCTSPIRLVGESSTVDPTSGEVLATYSTWDEPNEYLLTACGNRRASRCEACARVYADDTFHLIKSGLAGGRDVPGSVATHPRVFATFTAPSFGPVHSRPTDPGGHVRPCHPRREGPSCRARHVEDDPLLGQAIDPDTYDYAGAVLWNNRAGELWHTFAVYLRRHLAEALQVPRSRLTKFLRVEYAKVAEYQARGLVHFHAVIRLDGPAGPEEPPPPGADMSLLCDAITAAAQASRVHVPGHGQTIRWGKQLDLRPIEGTDEAGWTDAKVARYIAKYATKGAEAAGTVDRPLRTIAHLDHVRGLTDHARQMIRTCWELGDDQAHLNLREWAHMLGYGGHFSTKSRRYSTTLGTMRADRARFRADRARELAGLEPLPVEQPTIRVGQWSVAGIGYTNAGEEAWAETIREQHRFKPIPRPTDSDPAA